MADLVAGVVALCPDIDADAVKEIIDTDLIDTRINNFINMAYYATLPLTGDLGDCGGTDAQCQILLLLAAHFMTMYDRQAKSESVAGEWSISYMGRDGLGLNASLYGQQALILDCSGVLATAGLKSVLIHVADYAQLDDLPDG